MKTLKKRMTSATVAGLLMIGGACAVQAATLDTTTASPNDGILQNFTGIDWHANGAAWVQGFNLTSANNAGDTDTFTLTYQGFAAAINSTTPTPNLFVAPPGSATGGYELTAFATLTETATCVNAGCSSINLTLVSDSWTIYFDISPDANQALGTGFVDGVQILAGNFTSEIGNYTNFGPNGSGSAQLFGTVTSTNNAYVNPDLLGSTFYTSLYFPGQTGVFTRPALVNGASTGADTATDFVLQADSSQAFSVPEPATLSLLGIGLIGMGMFGRRKQS